jgi:hypothetical protein
MKIVIYNTVTLCVILYGFETLSHTLRENADLGWLKAVLGLKGGKKQEVGKKIVC